jgi:2-oxoglutarate ferredoxin oxidoreductase subunit gamma
VKPVASDGTSSKTTSPGISAPGETAIKLCGFGGQGIILAGVLIGKAAALFDGMQATFTQSYGPEARGGECSSSVIIGNDRANYPFVDAADVLVAMAQTAYDKYITQLKPGGLLILDSNMVEPHSIPEGATVRGVPATAMAEKLGNKIVANVVMLGFFTAVSGRISRDSMEKVIAQTVPKRFLDLNMNAFGQGHEHAGKPESRVPPARRAGEQENR